MGRAARVGTARPSTRGKGAVMPHPNQDKPLIQRLLEKTKVGNTPDDCWEWQGARTSPGWHGIMTYRGKHLMAHRVSFEHYRGPIPEGLFVLHRCDNPPCVNPDHLELGTLHQNSLDASRRGRMVRVPKERCKRGHLFEGNTYIHPITGRRSCHECIRFRNAQRWRREQADVHRGRDTREQAALG
jgi:hypothetical protein